MAKTVLLLILCLTPFVLQGKAKYEFERDNFSNRAELYSKHLSHFKGMNGFQYLEVGVDEGRSLLWMLENIATHRNSRVTGVEINVRDVLKTNIEASGQSKRVRLIAGDSKNELKRLSESFYDVVYIDGHHSAKSVLIDSVLAWPLLKEGGIMIFDDYMNRPHWPIDQRPRIAIDAFLSSYGDALEVLHRSRRLLVRKRKVPRCPDYYCTYLSREYWFGLKHREVYQLGRGPAKRIDMSEEEIQWIEKYIALRKLGDERPKPSKDFWANKKFMAVAKKLKIRQPQQH